MSKVLVDRELLENCRDAAKDAHAASLLKELEAILEAQPAEAEGSVEMGSDAWMALHLLDRLDVDSDDELRVQQIEEIVRRMGAALSAVTAERDRLLQFEAAYMEWQDKTEWVQQSAQLHELGKHRADVLKDRIDQLRAEVEGLQSQERYREQDLAVVIEQRDHYANRVLHLETSVLRIAGDYQPSSDAESVLALDEMRAALVGLVGAAMAAKEA